MRGRFLTLLFALGLVLLSLPSQSQLNAEAACDLSGYSPSMRPDPPGTPTEIGIGLTLLDLSAINDVQQTITIDALLTLQWVDHRLDALAGCRFGEAAIWTPEIRLFNSATVQPRELRQLLVEPNGTVVSTARYGATIASTAQIAEFPFDERTILLRLGSFSYESTDLTLRVIDQWTGRQPELTIPDWSIGEPSVAVTEQGLPRVGRSLPVFEYRISAARLSDYYVYKFVFPLCLIVMMSWSVFWVNAQHLAAQLSLAATSMLTLIAYQFTVNDLLPRVGYLTAMDQYVLSSSLLVFLALAEALVTGWLASRGRATIAETLDRVCRWLFPVAYVAIIFVTLW